jgi:glycosyltransferase involved in cell wall biosynthesis
MTPGQAQAQPLREQVSVVIPTFNRANLVINAVESALLQTAPPAEVIVIDDGSTDDTQERCRLLVERHGGRLRYVFQANRGEAAARNRGISVAGCELVAFLDSDDIWDRDKLQRQLPLFTDDPSLALTFTAYRHISAEGERLVRLRHWDPDPDRALRVLLDVCCVTPSTVIARRELFEHTGPFDERLKLSPDWDMWLRVASGGNRIGYLPQATMTYLWHGGNLSADAQAISATAQLILTRLFEARTLPGSLRRATLSKWALVHAVNCLAVSDGKGACVALMRAALQRPASIRLGWIPLFIRGLWTAVGQRTLRR